jgi:ADP-heptose:LPS heptosyltransferase/GT2 family glycosyltransferase
MRGGFRPGEDLDAESVPSEPNGLRFTRAADAGGTDLDVLMGYQIFLGRDPESSFVIADAKTSPVGAFIRALMASGEFQSSVLDRLASGRPLPHEAGASGPSAEQVAWLFRHVRVPVQAEAELRAAPDWRAWLSVLVAQPGVPRPPDRAAASPAEGPAPVAAGEGFVLIHIEQPKAGERLHPGKVIAGSGWAIAPADITEIAIHLDDHLLTHARYGLPRPDVARSFPHYRHVDHCGFTFTAEMPAEPGQGTSAQLIVSVRTARGDHGRKAVRLDTSADPLATGAEPGVAAAAAAGAPEPWPIRLAVEEAEIDAGRTLRLRGWAVSRRGVQSLSVSLGETRLGDARQGLPRPDIAKVHPTYKDAAQSGFALVGPIPDQVPAGPSFVRVEAADTAGQTRQVITPVTVPPPAPPPGGNADADAQAAAARNPIRCACDAARLTQDGCLVVAGWALAPEGIAGLEIEFDGLVVGSAVLGQLRPDVAEQFPGDPQAGESGFTFTQRLARPPGPGRHGVTLRIEAVGGARRLLEVPLTREAPSGSAPAQAGLRTAPAGPPEIRLEIDQPKLDAQSVAEPVHSAITISGWAVARAGVDRVSILCDERMLGDAHLGMRREDIGAAFPDYEGALLAGYALVLPPGTLPAGTHAIRVVVHGKAPGSRLERRFSLTVEATDTLPPGSAIRVRMPPAEAAFGLRLLQRHDFHPQFRIVVAAGAGQGAELAATLDRLAAQAYPAWQATIALPAGESTAKAAARAASADPAGRIRIGHPPQDPLPKRTTTGRRRPAPPDPPAATGPLFWLRLRAGDLPGCDALLEMACHLATHRPVDLLFTDELRRDPAQGQGGPRRPFFKPDWSPELLLGMNYLGRAWCAGDGLLRAAGLAPPDLATLPDYALALRLTENAACVGHLPRVLLESGDTADTQAQEKAALAEALHRRALEGTVEPAAAPGTWRVSRTLRTPERPKAAKTKKPDAEKPGANKIVPGLVSVIMPTCSARGLVRTAIKTIRANSAPALPGGHAVEIIALDNTPAHDKKARSWLRRNADRVIDMQGPFNWSGFNNAGAREAAGEYLLFLNDDIEVRQPGWLDALLQLAQQPEVGVVGARLLYPDGKVQHGGQYLADGHARHAFRFADSSSPGPFGIAAVAREVMSVTGACHMMHRRTFAALGGYEEAHSVVNNDLDFCLRAWRAGLSVLFTPHATLIHHELASRAGLEDRYDEARFAGAWRTQFLAGDRFRSPRLSLDSDHDSPDPEPPVRLHAGRRGPESASIRRILAVKLDHIGDFLTALPALHSLRQRFPHATIDLLAPTATAELARSQALFCEAIVFDFFHARSGEGRKGITGAEFDALRARLVPARYDLAIDLRMQPETREVLLHTGAGFLAGYDHDNRFPWLDVGLEWEGDERLVAKRAHISERLLQLVAATETACRPEGRQEGPVPPSVRPPALAALPETFTARPIVCMHPGVGNVVRQWPAAHYAGLIDLLALHGAHVVLVGAPEEAAIAEAVLRQVTAVGAAESLVGKVRLAQLPDVMRACVLFVGNNSGPQHLAAALGLPTIGIHSGVVDAAEWAPLGAQAAAIRRQMICSPCYLEFASDCPRNLACLTGLRPRDVFDLCRLLLPPPAASPG